jgi:hypothetical protein
MSDIHIEKNKVKVFITLMDDRTIWGYVFVSSYERVSDVLNNDQPFLPIQILEDRTGRKYDDMEKIVFINKRQIYRLED